MSQALEKGIFDRIGATKDAKLEAATATWAAARVEKTAAYSSLTLQDYAKLASDLGRVFVNSTPEGGAVSVDGYRWKKSTNAEGYAAAGTRAIVVERAGVSVSIKCEVHKDGVHTVHVDFANRAGRCK